MADEVCLAIMGYGLYDSFDVRIDPNATIEIITTLVLTLIGDGKPRNVVPAFSFEMSRHQWQALKPEKRLTDCSIEGERINVCIWWSSVG